MIGMIGIGHYDVTKPLTGQPMPIVVLMAHFQMIQDAPMTAAVPLSLSAPLIPGLLEVVHRVGVRRTLSLPPPPPGSDELKGRLKECISAAFVLVCYTYGHGNSRG